VRIGFGRIGLAAPSGLLLLTLCLAACGAASGASRGDQASWCRAHPDAVATTAWQQDIALPGSFTIYGGPEPVPGARRLAELGSATPVWIQASSDRRSMATIAAGLAAERPADYARACEIAATPPLPFEDERLPAGVAWFVAAYVLAAIGSVLIARRRGQRPAEIAMVLVLSVVAGPLGWWAAVQPPSHLSSTA